jgi:hypothetical protein
MNLPGILAFAVLLLISGVNEARAVAFNSMAGTVANCTGVQAGCTNGVLQAIVPDSSWQPNNPGGSSAVWVSFANNTGAGGVAVPNSTNLASANATETFSLFIPAGFASLSLVVWADDTGGIRLDHEAAYIAATNGTSAPNPVQGAHCADGGLTCTPGGGSTYLISLGGLAHTIQFDVFQRGNFTFGLLYQGELTGGMTPAPEPASLLLVGSALALVGFVARRRLQKS